ncbi:MAG: glycine cleavage system aminomethyltransferase GcvT [Candidatus Muirbacterium halophilum]|nr:glycine cleavage system aminomethyltransferase GcvT [Candidatus Muirbacterium halophilum]MCK9474691.1 glycine cleavage system aminomethyltransferase GcvT [Candidatus Muirbacterium halophilum]
MRTLFYELYGKYGGKVVDFHGWELPIQFEGIIKEHNCVREKVGLFDVSHMGEILVTGKGAIEFVDFAVTNNVQKLVNGQILYTPMCRQNGTIVDDLLVYKFNDEKILLVVNASNIEKDFSHLKSLINKHNVKIENLSSEYVQLALQGPKAAFIIDELIEENVDNIGFFHFIETSIDSVPVLISRTGYTQEDGFEIYFTKLSKAHFIYEKIIKQGEKYGICPIGLGARDTLRFEGGLMLYGNDLDDTTTPLEARLNWAMDLEKDFNGSIALLKQKEQGIERRLTGIKMIDKGIPRQGYELYDIDKNLVGVVTSGTKSPTLGEALALGYVKHPLWKKDIELYIKIRDKFLKCITVKYPFYKKPSLTMVNGL